MVVTDSVRRVSALVVGVAGAVALTAGCSSTSVGKPLPAVKPASSTAPSSVGQSSTPSSVASGLPSSLPSGLPSALPSSLPVGGGSSDPFCKELTNGDLSGLGSASASNLNGVLAKWDRLTAAAPAQIKGDAQAIDDYLHSVVSGTPDVAKAQAIGVAAQHIELWITSHCI